MEAEGALLTLVNDLHGHFCPTQVVPDQPHFVKAALAEGLEELVIVNAGLLVARMAVRSLRSVTYC